MSPDRDDMQERLRDQVPQPPFFARLRDPRSVLTDAERAARSYLQSNRLLVVVEAVADGSYLRPGIWYRVADTTPTRLVLGAGPHDVVVNNFHREKPGIWLNQDWCFTFPNAPGGLLSENIIYYPVN